MVQAIQIAIALLGILFETGCMMAIDRIPQTGGEVTVQHSVPGRVGWPRRPQFNEEEEEAQKTMPAYLRGLK